MSATLRLRRYHDDMSFPKPQYSRSAVDFAGKALAWELEIEPSQIMDCYETVNNWRSCHGYPINTFQATLRNKVDLVCKRPIIAQRLKRYSSILQKLTNYPNMRLSQMQDIGGLRAVVENMKQVRELRQCYLRMKPTTFRHTLASQQDYIETPKTTGYRGIHLVYRYSNHLAPAYTNLQVELQFRTKLQHLWATAVETIGIFLDESLKANQGSQEWLDFFALTSSAFAHVERSPVCAAHAGLSRKEIVDAVMENADAMHVRELMAGYSVAVHNIASGRYAVTEHGIASTYHLIVLDPIARTLNIKPFSRDRLFEASEQYISIEKQIANGRDLQAVLVSAGSVADLRRAYPNYFGDTHEFVQRLDALKRSKT